MIGSIGGTLGVIGGKLIGQEPPVPDTTKPSAPTNVRVASRTTTSVTVAWDAATDNVGVKHYRLRRNGTYVTQVSALSYTFTGLTEDTTYTFSVQTYDTSDNISSAISISGTTLSSAPSVPDAPTNLTATPWNGAVELKWTAPASTIYDSYAVYRDGVKITTLDGTVTAWPNRPVTNDVLYSYTVRSVYQGVESVNSNTATATPSATIVDTINPTAPQNLRVTDVTDTTATVSWDAAYDNVGVSNYRIRRNGTYVTQTSQLSYKYTGLTPSTLYTFGIQTYDTSNRTSAVTDVTGTTLSSTPVTPDPEPEPDPDPPVQTSGLVAVREEYPVFLQTATPIWHVPAEATFTPPASIGGAVIRGRQCKLPSNTTDYRIFHPLPFIQPGARIEINGGRSWWSKGLEIEHTQCNWGDWEPGGQQAPEGYTPPQGDGLANQLLHINGRTTHGVNTEPVVRIVEGMRGKGKYIWEGITYNSQQDDGPEHILWLNNIHVEQINWVRSFPDPVTGKVYHWGGDIFQPQSGPGITKIDGVVGTTYYQGFFLQQAAYGFPSGSITRQSLRRVVIHGNKETDMPSTLTHSHLLVFNSSKSSIIDLGSGKDGVFLDTRSDKAYLQKQSYALSSTVAAQVTLGPNPDGDPVWGEVTGVNYPYKDDDRLINFPVAGSTPARTGRATLSTVGPTVTPTEVYTGVKTIVTDGTVIQNMIINGQLTIRADNVTIKNCIVRAINYTGTTVQMGIKATDGKDSISNYTGLLVEDTLIECPPEFRNVYQGSGIAGGNYTLRNVEIRGFVDGIGATGVSSNGLRRYQDIDRVYVHQLPRYATDPGQTDGSHNDGIQDQGRTKLRVTRSVIFGGYTSAILIQQNLANVGTEPNHESVFIDDNFLDLEYDGGAVININESGKGVINNLTITNNTFGRSFPAKPRIILPNSTRDAATTLISNNKYADGAVVTTSVGG